MEDSFNYVQLAQQTSIFLASILLLHIYTIPTRLSRLRLKQFEHENGFDMTNHSINLQTNQASQVLFFTQIIEMSLLSGVIRTISFHHPSDDRVSLKLEINVTDNNFFGFDWFYSFYQEHII